MRTALLPTVYVVAAGTRCQCQVGIPGPGEWVYIPPPLPSSIPTPPPSVILALWYTRPTLWYTHTPGIPIPVLWYTWHLLPGLGIHPLTPLDAMTDRHL